MRSCIICKHACITCATIQYNRRQVSRMVQPSALDRAQKPWLLRKTPLQVVLCEVFDVNDIIVSTGSKRQWIHDHFEPPTDSLEKPFRRNQTAILWALSVLDANVCNLFACVFTTSDDQATTLIWPLPSTPRVKYCSPLLLRMRSQGENCKLDFAMQFDNPNYWSCSTTL